MGFSKVSFLFFFLLVVNLTKGQVCGSSGVDGPTNASVVINTYYPPIPVVNLASGATSIPLAGVPPTDRYGNTFGNTPISSGDLLIVIQMQDGIINRSDTRNYGSGTNNAGPDGLGGTGYTSLGNAGLYEYVVALNTVPLSGGVLNIRGAGSNRGLVHSYVNHPGDGNTVGKKTFQVIRLSQFSSLTLSRSISSPPFNGSVGGIIAFDVAGDFNFNGYSIDASARGFRGGYQRVQPSGCSISSAYVTANESLASGKGEGIVGTPKYMWDGYNEVDNGNSWPGFPGPSFGKGAPANAGGGGYDHNSGGGGGANGGFGGVGGLAWQGAGGCSGDPGNPSGGRPGHKIMQNLPERLFMGGGGGGGDANNATNGTKGGVGGGIVLISAGRILGNGTIKSDGGNGDRGAFLAAPDGAGGGGAGGTVFLHVSNASPSSQITISAKGGRGGNTANDSNDEHGPGGGGGGGVVWYAVPQSTIQINVGAGLNGQTNDGIGNTKAHGAAKGEDGFAKTFSLSDLPSFSSICFPILSIKKRELLPGIQGARTAGNNANYIITIQNADQAGGAGGVKVVDKLPKGFTFISCSATYSGGAIGPVSVQNIGTADSLVLGDFTIPAGSSVVLNLVVFINYNVVPGIYHNGTQVHYLDPTRTLVNKNRTITPVKLAVPGTNTTYEGGIYAGNTVPGENYDGSSSGPIDEDVVVISSGTIDSLAAACVGSSVKFDVTPPALTPPFTYQWSGPGVLFPANNVKNPIIQNVKLSDTGVYTVIVTDKNGFKSIYQTRLVLDKIPDVVLNNPSTTYLCQGSSVVLSATGGATYRWYRNNILISGVGNSTLSAAISGTYRVEAVSSNGCVSALSDSIQLISYRLPNVEFMFSSLCAEDTVIFKNLSDTSGAGPIIWRWDFGDGNNSVSTNSAHFYQTDGLKKVTLTGTSLICPALSATKVKDLQLERPVPGIRYPRKYVLPFNSILLQARSFGFKYQWLPSLGLNNPNISNPRFQYDQPVDYFIRITSGAGCVTVDTLNIWIFEKEDIQVPKAFSPNGDGRNDLLDVYLIGLEKLIFFRVFNRWGQLLYETKDLYQRWDGTFRGVKQPIDTYVWIAEGVVQGGGKIIRRGQTAILR